jgi:hypothetical protein
MATIEERRMTFKYKTVRCEWQVVVQGVDQYGMSTKEREVLASWGSYDEAKADLPTYGKESEWVRGRWLPFNNSGYQILEVQYREVTVKEWEE